MDRPEMRAPCTATPIGSERAAVGKSMPDGIGKQWRAGRRMRSAKPPGMVIPTTPSEAQRW